MTRRERERPGDDERRAHRRVDARHLPALVTHIDGEAAGSVPAESTCPPPRSSSPAKPVRVRLLDLSEGGVRIETTRHMRPGQVVTVRFSVDERIVTMGAVVVRASVVKLGAEEIRYETGLSLDDEFDCDRLQLALVERQRPASDSDPVPDQEPDETVPFTLIDDGELSETNSLGWRLSGTRHCGHRLSDTAD